MSFSSFMVWRWFLLCVGTMAAGSIRNEAAEAALGNQPSPSAGDRPLRFLRTAEQIHLLPREEADRGHRAVIRGVVTCLLPEARAVVLQDSTRGIYVDGLSPTLGPFPRLGELLEIEGITQPGYFAPCVRSQRITRLGEAPLPQPIHPAWDQLINGSLDTQYVEIQGLVTSVHANGITLLTHGGKMHVALSRIDEDTISRWEDSLVRFRGCLFAAWDGDTHLVKVGDIRLIAPEVTIEEPAPPDLFAISAKRAWELRLFDPQASALQRVKVSGQILEERAGEFYLIDGTNGLRFLLKRAANLQVGDLAEIVGFPNVTGPSPFLREAVARKVGSSALPPPKKLLPENLSLGENDSTLVQLEAELLHMSGGENPQTLELQAGLRRFRA